MDWLWNKVLILPLQYRSTYMLQRNMLCHYGLWPINRKLYRSIMRHTCQTGYEGPLGNLMIPFWDFSLGCRLEVIICVYFPTIIFIFGSSPRWESWLGLAKFLYGSPPSATWSVNIKPKKRKGACHQDLSLSAIRLLIINWKSDWWGYGFLHSLQRVKHKAIHGVAELPAGIR